MKLLGGSSISQSIVPQTPLHSFLPLHPLEGIFQPFTALRGLWVHALIGTSSLWGSFQIFLTVPTSPGSSSNSGAIGAKGDMVDIHGETSEDPIWSSLRKCVDLDSVVGDCCNQLSILTTKSGIKSVSHNTFVPQRQKSRSDTPNILAD